MSIQPKEPANEAGKTARQGYLEFARKVIGEVSLDYPSLYQRFAQNDWAAIKLDDAVAEAALHAGQSATESCRLLLQSPYVQYQVHQKQVGASGMVRYVESTVRQALQEVRSSQKRARPQLRVQSEIQKPDMER